MPSPSLLPAQYSSLDSLGPLSNGSLECDQRTLQLALELSRLHLQADISPNGSPAFMYSPSLSARYGGPPSPTSAAAAAAAALSQSLKRSQNMTECVAVPSSEHVAEIVGKQGCKIKALRSKTNTYIKTPIRGEEPVFVITGRREDVEIAKAEILQAADHFTQIRAQRRLHPPPHVPGQVTIQMPVPLRLVGLIVGPKGQTIKKVQQDTVTYIITPGRDKDPVFEITGCKEGVQRAKELIEDHVLARTGSTLEELLLQQNDPTRQRSSSLDNGAYGMDIWKDTERLLGYGGSTEDLSGSGKDNAFKFDIGCWNVPRETSPTPDVSGRDAFFSSGNKQTRSFSIAGINNPSPGSFDFMEHPHARRLNSDPMPTFAPSIWNSGGGHGSSGCGSAYQNNMSLNDGPNYFASGFSNNFGIFNKASLNSTGDSACSSSPAESITSQRTKRECILCQDRDIVAALVPCGHNLFCMDCARIQQKCPICQQSVNQVIRIQADL
ncbi:RNA-binding protein MEX3D-like isoform X2 [Paramacrobiotus metropolitanus]|uniref:RNA-binding protein MEX3D-like isoform X2 n=1 Tax=Paramacrobiotus metropolitanus TaxID=2943436 RepID=UPI002445DEBC|nr:RNA-binding protein MEX3D-like isoform X2 [Paramacrobiotus metropolitanus]